MAVERMTLQMHRPARMMVLLGLIVSVFLGWAASGGAATVHSRITQWTLPQPDSHPSEIVAAGTSSAWFANGLFTNPEEPASALIERIDGSGNIEATSVSSVLDVTRGPGGIWLVGSGDVGRILGGGHIEQFSVQTGYGGSLSLASGAGGYLWLTKRFDQGRDAIQRISRQGAVKSFLLPHRVSGPNSITRGPDGAMWFTEIFGDRIGRITSTGKITEFPIGVRPSGDIVAGPEGDLWFATSGGTIGRLSPATGEVAFFWQDAEGPLVAGPDGSIWFAREYGKIARIAPGGRLSVIDLPGRVTRVKGLAVGPDGTIWYTAEKPGVVGRILPGPLSPSGPRIGRSG